MIEEEDEKGKVKEGRSRDVQHLGHFLCCLCFSGAEGSWARRLVTSWAMTSDQKM